MKEWEASTELQLLEAFETSTRMANTSLQVERTSHREDSDGRLVSCLKPLTCNMIPTSLKSQIEKKRVLHVIIPHILL